MRSTRFRAWRFVHPDVEAGREFGGVQVSPVGRIEMVSEAKSIRQAIQLLLSTAPGERVMRPTYGCYLNRLMFLPNDDTTAGLAIHYVSRALDRWEPRIEVLKLDALRRPQTPERLDIVLEYRIKATQQLDHLTFPVALSGEEG